VSTTPKLQEQKSEKVKTINEAATTNGDAIGNQDDMMNGYFGDVHVDIDDIPSSLDLARHNRNLYYNLLDADALFIDMFHDDDMLSMWALSNTCTSAHGGCDECMIITLGGCEGQSA